MEDLDRDGPLVVQIPGQPDAGHSAPAELSLDGVPIGDYRVDNVLTNSCIPRPGGREVTRAYSILRRRDVSQPDNCNDSLDGPRTALPPKSPPWGRN